MTTTYRLRSLLPAALLIALAAACGGDATSGGGDTSPVTAPEASPAAVPDTAAISAPASDGQTSDADPDTDPDADPEWTPGPVQMRVVQLLDDAVDVHVRTSGVVQAFPVWSAVASGTVTELVAPPVDGSLVVTTAGSGDAECVGSCPHIIAQVSATLDEGPVRTLVLYEADGAPATFDLWESPTAARTDSSNAMPAADPAAALVVTVAVALEDADFGLRLGFVGTAGCVEPANLDNILVGGNQTPAFAFTSPSADVVLYDNTDRECVGEAVGGPFTIAGGAGSRSLLILTGAPGAMSALIVPMVGSPAGTPPDETGGATAGDDDDRTLAIELLTPEVQTGLGVPGDQSACVAALLVDALGVDVLLRDGALIELDTLPAELEAPATAALVESVDVCGVDPTLFGG